MMRYEGQMLDLPHPEIPRISVPPIATIGDNSWPLHWYQYSFNFQDIFTWIHASHSVKLGGEFRYVPTDHVNTNNYIPRYDFLDLLNFANDNARQETRQVDPVSGDPVTTSQRARRREFALFVQDDWKVTRNLTVNVGMRYENFLPPTDADGLLPDLVLAPGRSFSEQLANASTQYVDRSRPPDNNNIAPRFGFAWNAGGRGKTAVRGGYGITYDRPGAGLGYSSNPPLRAAVTLGPLFGNTFTYGLGDPSKPFLGYPVDAALRKGLDAHNGINGLRVNVSTVDPALVAPYVHNWLLGVEQEAWGWVLGINYIGSAGHHLNSTVNVNRYVGDLLDGRFDGYNPSFSTISWAESDSNSIYNGATGYARRPFSRGFTLEAAFTVGKVLTDYDSSLRDVNNRRADRSLASYDVARRLSILGVWEIPLLKGKKGPAGLALAGWQLSGTTILQSGQPLNVTTTATWPRGDFNADGTGGDRPNNLAETVRRTGFEKSDYLNGIFKTTDFPTPTPGTNGNLGRNVFRGPGFIQMDASLSKKFSITERVALQLKVDAYNAPNRVNLLEPVTDLSNSANFGKSVDQLSPRAFQAYLRLTF
jgi:hypothetical protein